MLDRHIPFLVHVTDPAQVNMRPGNQSRVFGRPQCRFKVPDRFFLVPILDCDLAQGYWISKPKPAAALMQWLVETFWGLRQVKGSLRTVAS